MTKIAIGSKYVVRHSMFERREADGSYQQTILIGLDDASLVGAPQQIIAGKLSDLRRPDAVIIDRNGAKQLWPDDPFRLGRTFEMNDRRAIVVGVCEASRTFQTFPIIYARYSQAIQFVPQERKVMSFILAQSSPGESPSILMLATPCTLMGTPSAV